MACSYELGSKKAVTVAGQITSKGGSSMSDEKAGVTFSSRLLIHKSTTDT